MLMLQKVEQLEARKDTGKCIGSNSVLIYNNGQDAFLTIHDVVEPSTSVAENSKVYFHMYHQYLLLSLSWSSSSPSSSS